MKRYNVLITCLCLAMLPYHVHVEAGTWNDTRRLLEDLMDGYDPRIRPLHDQTRQMAIRINFEVHSMKIDEISGKFSVVGTMELIWRDENLVWDPAQYGHIYSVSLPYTHVWYPKVRLANPYSSSLAIDPNDPMDVRATSSGDMYIYPAGFFDFNCEVKASQFPFDEQECHMVFFDNTYTGSELIFEMGDTSTYKTFKGNGEWMILHLSRHVEFEKKSGKAFAIFTYRLRRQYFFATINLILPIVLLFVLQLFVFILPVESGERVGVMFKIVIGITVFIIFISNELPKVSEPLPAVCYYLLATMCLFTLMTVAVIINMAIFYKEGSVPACLTAVTNTILCRCCKRNTDQQVSLKQCPEGTPDLHMIVTYHSPNQNVPNVNWKDVSKAIDIICIVIFLLSFIALNGYGVYYAMSQQKTYRTSYLSDE